MNSVSAYITLMEAAGFPGCETVGDFVDLVENVTGAEFDLIDEVQFKDPNVGVKVYDEIRRRAHDRKQLLDDIGGLLPTPRVQAAMDRAAKNSATASRLGSQHRGRVAEYNRQKMQSKQMADAMKSLRAMHHDEWKSEN